MDVTGRDYITAGKAIFTLEVPRSFRDNRSPDNPVAAHYTFRVEKAEPREGWTEPTYFVGLLTGPDNGKDFTYLGILNPKSGALRVTRKSCQSEDSWPVRLLRRVLERLWTGEAAAIEKSGFRLHDEGRCCRCGRRLTTPESCRDGIGPECRKVAGFAALAEPEEEPWMASEDNDGEGGPPDWDGRDWDGRDWASENPDLAARDLARAQSAGRYGMGW